MEGRYFISSLPVKVKQFARAVRSHWGIENTCHWCLDVTYREDESRIREKHLRENFAWLNRFTLSLLKQHGAKDSIAMKRRACGWNENFMLEIPTGTRAQFALALPVRCVPASGRTGCGTIGTGRPRLVWRSNQDRRLDLPGHWFLLETFDFRALCVSALPA